MSKIFKLKEISSVTSGSTAPKDNYFEEEGIPFIRAGHLEELIEKNNLHQLLRINPMFEKKLKLKKVPTDTILFAKSGMSSTKNRIYKCTQESYIVNHLAAIIPNEDLIISDYLQYFLRAYKPSKLIVDESYPSIRIQDIQNIEIKLPDIDTQKSIVKLLKKSEGIIKKRQSQLSALDKLTQSVFLVMFGDPVKNPKNFPWSNLGSLGKWKSGGTPKRSVTEYFSGDIPWLSSGELENLFTYESEEYITEKAIDESAAKLIEVDSLLLGMYDTAALKSTIVKRICTCNQAIAFSKLDETKASTLYVYTYIQLAKEYLKRQQRGVRQKNLNLSMIKELDIFIPPLELQYLFEKRLLEIEDQKEKLQKSLKGLENLFDSLHQKAFKGELFQEIVVELSR